MTRLIDVALSTIGLVVLAPVLAVIAIAVRLSSPGPILFRQQRIGHHFVPFTMVKFRTMAVVEGAEAGRFDAGDTRRVTAVGRVLRRTKLDELPQLWNVLIGDMALVGPRPEIAKWVDPDDPRWVAALSVRPGITDPAAIEFADEESVLAEADDPVALYEHEILPRKLTLYNQYVATRSWRSDLSVVFRTVRTIAGVGG